MTAMPETRASLARLGVNIRRLVTSYLILWLMKVTPKSDKHTLLAVLVMIQAMNKDSAA
jgi:hypothetical protein